MLIEQMYSFICIQLQVLAIDQSKMVGVNISYFLCYCFFLHMHIIERLNVIQQDFAMFVLDEKKRRKLFMHLLISGSIIG